MNKILALMLLVFITACTNTANVPSCPNELSGILTAPVMDLSEFSAIIPLGNLYPPGHSVPTDHIYLVSNNEKDHIVNLYSPGDIILSSLYSSITTDKATGEVISSDYSIQFIPCKGITIELGHVADIPENLKKVISGKKGQCHSGNKMGNTNEQCTYKINTMTKAGDLIGYGNAKVGMATLDLYSWNDNINPPNYANPKRYSPNALHAFCPLDLYSGELREQLYSRLGGLDKPRTIEPRCGEIMQDVLGTLQGAWFGEAEDPMNSGKVVSLVHDNINPTLAVVLVAGHISQPGRMTFVPRHEGRFNREFSEVTADGKIYCYHDEAEEAVPLTGMLLIRLENDREITIEHKEGECNENEVFEMPYQFVR
ncbi:MAG: hypothetical protein ABIJ34_06355 [archaeon]